jgi:hypothetical protein
MKEALSSSETSVLQEPHGVTSQKTPFFRSPVTHWIVDWLNPRSSLDNVEKREIFPLLFPEI